MIEHPCVSFMLIQNGKILLERRSMSKEHDPGLVAIPGGHMEIGEAQQETLLREMEEELAVVPTQYRYLCSYLHKTTEWQKIHYYVIEAWQGTIEAHEADEVFWHDLSDRELDIDSDRLALDEFLAQHALV
ncbi:NUDIX hydrolase [Vibrio porteresiae]|uniref:8-oxo-dGTP diphosphatase n=1 Tax=Vibrio porteresiae DSM 19223 TaxID=1123496 RepID=A0ABZ0QH62_9VIBR|nr:NUDIX domain-containing protein [Vibrio porteresiae]WPC75838.1 NUDIX domain-containing protein [Vibrio porteresiae DSM 19223]